MLDANDIYMNFSGASIIQVQHEITEISAMFEGFSQYDYLDTSEDISNRLQLQHIAFNNSVSKIESDLVKCLQDLLSRCHSQNDQIKILAFLSSIFNRPCFRTVIHEYQNNIFKHIMSLIKKLYQECITSQEKNDRSRLWSMKACVGSHESVIYTRYVIKRIAQWLSYLKIICPEQSANDSFFGEKVADFERLITKLDPAFTVSSCLEKFSADGFLIQGCLLSVTHEENGSFNLCAEPPTVHDHFINVIRNFNWMGYSIPFIIIAFYRRLKKLDPFFCILNSALKAYMRLSQLADSSRNALSLIQSAKSRMHAVIRQCKNCIYI